MNQPLDLLRELTLRIRLIWSLLKDRRVKWIVKLIPFASLVYVILPDWMPGPIDDAVAVWLGTLLFFELCPKEVVAEHRRAITE